MFKFLSGFDGNLECAGERLSEIALAVANGVRWGGWVWGTE